MALRGLVDVTYPRASLILCCQHIEINELSGLRGALAQRYPDHEVLLVLADGVASDEDIELLQQIESDALRLLRAPAGAGAQGLLDLQRAGAAAADPRSEILVWMDAQATIHPEALVELVEPLTHSTHDAALGWSRWEAGVGLWSQLASRVAGLITLGAVGSGAAVGGSAPVALRRAVYERWDARIRRRGGAAGGLGLAGLVQSIGLDVAFCERAAASRLAPTRCADSLAWTHHQLRELVALQPALGRRVMATRLRQVLEGSALVALSVAGLGWAGLGLALMYLAVLAATEALWQQVLWLQLERLGQLRPSAGRGLSLRGLASSALADLVVAANALSLLTRPRRVRRRAKSEWHDAVVEAVRSAGVTPAQAVAGPSLAPVITLPVAATQPVGGTTPRRGGELVCLDRTRSRQAI